MSVSVDQQRTSAARCAHVVVGDLPNGDLYHPHTLAPTKDTIPDLVTSPLRADGLAPCSGLMICLTYAADVSAAPPVPADPVVGFTVTVWIRDPVVRTWGRTAAFTTPGGEWFSTRDFNGGDLFFQITGAAGQGSLFVHVVEL